MPRIGSSGKGDELKRERPPKPRERGGGDGRTEGSRRWPSSPAYKAREFPRQVPVAGVHAARQIHSVICAITSPNNRSTADQTSAEMKLAA